MRSGSARRLLATSSFKAPTRSELDALFRSLGLLSPSGSSSTDVISGVFTGKRWILPSSSSSAPPLHEALNPATNEVLAKVYFGTKSDYNECVKNAAEAAKVWAGTPAPVRGEVVGKLGDALRAKKRELGMLVSLEMGKIKAEGLGEVQEYIDVCDMARGMSRSMAGGGGLIIPSEREKHIILETWHPLGVCGIISAMNFPCAVIGWNTAISLMCGNTQIVKGAESGSLVSIATQRVLTQVLEECGVDPAVAVLCQGTGECGQWLCEDDRVKLVSFTGSTKTGKQVSSLVHGRFAQCLLELGGNNATIVMPDADMQLALRSVLFSAVGTCGQRCTSLRRLLVHRDCYDAFVSELVKMYSKVRLGNPLDDTVLCGPLHNQRGVQVYWDTLQEAKQQGGRVLVGGERVPGALASGGGNYVQPTIIEISAQAPIVNEERFVPILYVDRIDSLEHAVQVNNQVAQGLTSALFTQNMKQVFSFLSSPTGSDCGIANINTSCSGAEIGGAFGGNKETGGGRECGSDSWKQYMRRTTSTINFGDKLPLAQGITFE